MQRWKRGRREKLWRFKELCSRDFFADESMTLVVHLSIATLKQVLQTIRHVETSRSLEPLIASHLYWIRMFSIGTKRQGQSRPGDNGWLWTWWTAFGSCWLGSWLLNLYFGTGPPTEVGSRLFAFVHAWRKAELWTRYESLQKAVKTPQQLHIYLYDNSMYMYIKYVWHEELLS